MSDPKPNPAARAMKLAAGIFFLVAAWLIFAAAYDQFMYYRAF